MVEIPATQGDPRQHAKPIDLAAGVAFVPRPAQELQGQLFRPPGLAGAEGCN